MMSPYRSDDSFNREPASTRPARVSPSARQALRKVDCHEEGDLTLCTTPFMINTPSLARASPSTPDASSSTSFISLASSASRFSPRSTPSRSTAAAARSRRAVAACRIADAF